MPDKKLTSGPLGIVALIVALLIVSAFFYMFGTVIYGQVRSAVEFMPWHYWLMSTVAVAVLFFIAGFTSTWLRRDERQGTGEPERRGSHSLGAVRDDEFERLLDWMREHKRLVKLFKKLSVAMFVFLIALLWMVAEFFHR